MMIIVLRMFRTKGLAVILQFCILKKGTVNDGIFKGLISFNVYTVCVLTEFMIRFEFL